MNVAKAEFLKYARNSQNVGVNVDVELVFRLNVVRANDDVVGVGPSPASENAIHDK